ncbi:hypothetical protein H2O64_01970 [Kordia sp. YSTF-M3]|uniref:Uncharacterized protein n=1 Tax=Kordia aestuariivivens TaxID=2759037 RepID=A0ABR7Q4C8_9FLAO|nr:hypothetical protein [Kordia aestuariivivens]MBC8753419.1 hypothetical protein [Kordia aestuariivivens]
MEKSIEHIWKEGFVNNDTLVAPKIQNLYNQKSKHLGDKLIRMLNTEPKVLLIMAIVFIFGNYAIGNDFWSGSIASIWCIIWYFIIKKQIQNIENANKETNCYEFLKSLHKLLLRSRNEITKMLWIGTPILILPMVIYTYYNQYEKTFGEIFGVESLSYPNELLFIIVPLGTIFSVVIYRLSFKYGYGPIANKLKQLITDIETLKN